MLVHAAQDTTPTSLRERENYLVHNNNNYYGGSFQILPAKGWFPNGGEEAGRGTTTTPGSDGREQPLDLILLLPITTYRYLLRCCLGRAPGAFFVRAGFAAVQSCFDFLVIVFRACRGSVSDASGRHQTFDLRWTFRWRSLLYRVSTWLQNLFDLKLLNVSLELLDSRQRNRHSGRGQTRAGRG